MKSRTPDAFIPHDNKEGKGKTVEQRGGHTTAILQTETHIPAPFEARQLLQKSRDKVALSGCIPYFATSTRLSESWISESLLRKKIELARPADVCLACALLLIG